MSKRKAVDTSGPQAKRQKVSPNSPQQDFTSNEIRQLLTLFNHLESQKIQNQTLDRCIYNSYKTFQSILNSDDTDDNAEDNDNDIDNDKDKNRDQMMEKALDERMKKIVNNDTIMPSNVFFEQMIQLKAQIKAIRLLSRDIGLSQQLSDLSHGIDNPHSWQRPYIDPLRTENPSICKHSKYKLNKEDDDDIIIDNSPQTIEELVYQNEYNAIKKAVNRRRMLKNYVSHCEHSMSSSKNNGNNKKKSKNKQHQFDKSGYKKSKEELQLLELCELQNKVRNEVYKCRMDKFVYDTDNLENETLLDPDLFVRSAQIGLHFDPHINSANHPPPMATSNDIFPFYYAGRK